MNINELTIGQVKEISQLFGNAVANEFEIGRQYIGQYVIIRTYAAGVWFGLLSEKCKNEVILNDARRMWRWKSTESISLSAVAQYGICQNESKITPAVSSVWLEAIEIIELTPVAINSIQGAKIVEAN